MTVGKEGKAEVIIQMRKTNFLQVDKDSFGQGLTSVEILILAQVEEFERNGQLCYITNEQFSIMFGESLSKVKRSLDHLEELGLIHRETFSKRDGGKGKMRVIHQGSK